MQEHFFEHFYRDGHNGFLEEVAITFIDKTDGRDPKNRENYWIRTLKTLAPEGLNIIEDCSDQILYIPTIIIYKDFWLFGRQYIRT